MALPRTPCAFRLRQARTVPPQNLTFSVATTVPTRASHARTSSTRGAEAHPGVLLVRQSRRARTDYTAHRFRERGAHGPERFRLTRSRPCGRKSPCGLKMFSTVPRGLDTPFARCSRPPCHGFAGPPPRATPWSAGRTPHRSEAPDQLSLEKMPLANLCSRSIITSTRWIPPFPSFRLTPVLPNAFSSAPSEPTPSCGG